MRGVCLGRSGGGRLWMCVCVWGGGGGGGGGVTKCSTHRNITRSYISQLL